MSQTDQSTPSDRDMWVNYRASLKEDYYYAARKIEDLTYNISSIGLAFSIAVLTLCSQTENGHTLPIGWKIMAVLVWILYASCIALNYHSQEVCKDAVTQLMADAADNIRNNSKYDSASLKKHQDLQFKKTKNFNMLVKLFLIHASVAMLACVIWWLFV